MKKWSLRWIIITLLILILIFQFTLSLFWDQKSNRASLSSSESPVSMVIATDLHYLSDSLHDRGEFFTDLIEKADGKNMFYIEEITDAFIDKMIELKPEILILSGDLTFNGEKKSHLDLEKKLDKLQKQGINVLVTAGNHDIERSSAAKFSGKGYEHVDTVSKNEFSKIYEKYGLQQSLHKDDNSLSYIYEARKDLWLLFLDSNSNGDNILKDSTIEWVKKMLTLADTNHIKILSITHQNILSHNSRFTDGFLVDNYNKIQELYKKYDVVANFSGHIHIQHIVNKNFTEVVTSSLAVSPHQFGIISYNGSTLEYETKKLNISKWAKSHEDGNKELLNFTEVSREFMIDVAKRKFIDNIPNKSISDADKKVAMQTLAELNAEYFAGNQINVDTFDKGIGILREYYGGFTYSYLDTILSEANRENHRIILSISE